MQRRKHLSPYRSMQTSSAIAARRRAIRPGPGTSEHSPSHAEESLGQSWGRPERFGGHFRPSQKAKWYSASGRTAPPRDARRPLGHGFPRLRPLQVESKRSLILPLKSNKPRARSKRDSPGPPSSRFSEQRP